MSPYRESAAAVPARERWRLPRPTAFAYFACVPALFSFAVLCAEGSLRKAGAAAGIAFAAWAFVVGLTKLDRSPLR